MAYTGYPGKTHETGEFKWAIQEADYEGSLSASFQFLPDAKYF